MQKVYTAADFPLATGNVTLAFALYISGIPFADEELAKKEKREPIPLTNIYDADLLHRLGYTTGGIEQAALQAVQDRKKGIVEFGFPKTHALAANQSAFIEYQKALQRDKRPACEIVAEISQRLASGQLSRGMALSAATFVVIKRWRDELKDWQGKRAFGQQAQKNANGIHDARKMAETAFFGGDFYAFAAVLMDARPVFVSLWHRYPPTIRRRRKGQASFRDGEKPGTKIGKFPGFSAYSTNAGNELRKEIGAPEI